MNKVEGEPNQNQGGYSEMNGRWKPKVSKSYFLWLWETEEAENILVLLGKDEAKR